jgi:hypothetical protein
VVQPEGQPLVPLIHDPALGQRLIRAAAAAAANMTMERAVGGRGAGPGRAGAPSADRGSRDDERRRAERKLYDGAQQRMSTLALSLAMPALGPGGP